MKKEYAEIETKVLTKLRFDLNVYTVYRPLEALKICIEEYL